MSATPRPWKVCEGDAHSGGRKIEGGIYEVTVRACGSSSGISGIADAHGFSKEEAQRNAALIVQVVNAHDALVEALEEAHRYFRNRTGNEEIQLSQIIGTALRQAGR